MKAVISFLLVIVGILPLSAEVRYAKLHTRLLPGVSEREYAVYLPPGYEADTLRHYPVLYLLHGAGGSHTDWPELGRLEAYADSLTAAGAMDEMIIVCPDGRCRDNVMWFNMDRWKAADHFFDELIPHVDSTYRTIAAKEGRAIAGLSMGGGATVQYALNRPELFAAACPVTAYLEPLSTVRLGWIQKPVREHMPFDRIASSTDEQLARWNSVAWLVDCGDKDITAKSNARLHDVMARRGLVHRYVVRPGRHNWKYWQSFLPIMLPFVSSHFGR